MAVSSITSAQAGTAVVAGAGSLKGLAITMPIGATADTRVPLTLLDATAASGVGPVLYSARLSDLQAFIYEPNPSSVPLTPGGPTGQAAGTLFINTLIAFTAGLYVKSCPTGMTFSATT